MINVVRGASKKPISSDRLATYFEQKDDLNGTLYLGYPIIGTAEGAYDIDAILISEEYGLIIFDIIEGPNENDRTDIQDDLYNKFQSRLLQNKKLVKKRDLMVDISVVTFAPAWKFRPNNNDFGYELVTSEAELDNFLNDLHWNNNEYFNKLVEDVQMITTIKSRPKREKVKTVDSKGGKLIKLEESIANLDSNQSQAVIETVDGVQRLRGLAGSGKTIILALKVAYLHSNNPDWEIAVTFNTRSLKNQFIDLITRFTYEHTREEPDWRKIKIVHAWGNSNTPGIYYDICNTHDIEFLPLSKASSLAQPGQTDFDAVCKKALDEITEFQEMYDVILIDEAQDFSKSFLQLCYNILKAPKRLIYAYDELQSLSRMSMDSPENIFGLDGNGIILQKCYRNSRPILATAHSLGFGIYYDKGLIQMFDRSSLWKDIGYTIVDGELEEGSHVKLGRTDENSPIFLESHSHIDDIIQFNCFKSEQEQAKWIALQIKKNLEEDELEYQDIMVIHTDPLTTKSATFPIRQELHNLGINSHLAGVTTSPDIFNQGDSITITSIYRAKGNEAAMIYVVDGQNCYKGLELSRKRNILFTAITRSKAWVRVTGYGKDMLGLIEEFKRVKENNFQLELVYPTEEQRKKMHIVNRDMTQEEKKKRASSLESMNEVVKSLKRGEFYIEDLPDSIREFLREQLKNDMD